MRKPKANITPDDVGTFYTRDGETIFRLSEYIRPEAEPQIMMVDLSDEKPITMPLSYFKDFVRLLPEREISQPKKPRSDKDQKHKKKALTGETKTTVDIDKILICTPTQEGQDWLITFGENECRSPRIAFAITGLFELLGIPDARAYIEAQPDCENKPILLAALGVA